MLYEMVHSLENGFQLFDWYHVSWLVFTILFIVIMFHYYSKSNHSQRKKIRIIWALAIALLEVIKNMVLFSQDIFWYGSLPLHLCGMGIFIVLIHAFTNRGFMDMLLYCLTMPGALMALLTPDWTFVSAFNYLHFHSFLFHVLLFAYPVIMLLAKELRLALRNIWQPITFLCLVVPPLYNINKIWGTNFMFVNRPPAGTPLMLLEQFTGEQYYILGFIGLVILFWFLLLVPVIFLNNAK